jgi:hypothetical protein
MSRRRESAKAYLKKFREQPHDQEQAMHTLRELIIGIFLATKGFTVTSKRKIDDKTPDWSIADNGALKCIIEVVNFHTPDAAKDSAIHADIAGQAWTFIYQPDHTDRLFETLRVKSSKYRDIVTLTFAARGVERCGSGMHVFRQRSKIWTCRGMP